MHLGIANIRGMTLTFVISDISSPILKKIHIIKEEMPNMQVVNILRWVLCHKVNILSNVFESQKRLNNPYVQCSHEGEENRGQEEKSSNSTLNKDGNQILRLLFGTLAIPSLVICLLFPEDAVIFSIAIRLNYCCLFYNL